jgi:quinol monooxygenase YgiN
MKTQLKTLVLALGMLLPQMALANGDNSPRALLAYLNVQPGTERQFLQAAKDVIVKSRLEPGAIIYNLHQSVTHPTQFVFYELYRSDADLQSHRNSKHVIDFLKNVDPILIEGKNRFVLVEYR